MHLFYLITFIICTCYRYPSYSWAILEYRSVDSILYYNEISTIDLVDPCDTPESIKCGNTCTYCVFVIVVSFYACHFMYIFDTID